MRPARKARYPALTASRRASAISTGSRARLIADAASTPVALARELLALSKLNWNNTQFDNSEPIIVTAARKVGKILKYVDPAETPQTRYSFYM